MKISEILKQHTSTQVTFEILPPFKGDSIDSIYNSLEPLLTFNPPYVNVTYHREEVIYKQHPSGLMEKHIVHKRPGTVAIAAALHYKYGIELVPHIICGGFNKEETENALIELNFLGIHNILAIRGDADKQTRTFLPEKDGHEHTIDLVNQIINLNKGIYLDDELENQTKTDFCVGVAGYPEKHPEAPNFNSDLHVLKEKVDLGAKYIVTQMFFDNKHYFNFVDACRKIGINVPIIPGLKPIATLNHLNVIPNTFHVEISEILEKEVRKCKTNSEVRRLGEEWAIMQAKDLIQADVPIIHFYTMGKSDNIHAICKAVF